MPYPPNDGGCIGVLVMIQSLKKLGHNVTILTMNTHKHFFNTDELPDNLKTDIEWHSCYVDTSINPVGAIVNLFFSRLPYNAKRFISKTFKNKLTEILKNKKFDVIQLEGLYLYPYISTIRKYSKALIAFRSHNVEHEIWKRSVQNQEPSLKRAYSRIISRRLQKVEKHSLKHFDLLIPVTDRDGKMFSQLGNQKPVYTAPTGIDFDEVKKSNTPPPHNTICFIGALDWEPNQEGLLWFINKVWNIVLKECPDTRFHIAGRNAPPYLNHKLNKKNIIFHGCVADAHEFVSRYNIVIVPLLTGSGMRVKLIESMALQKPIVSSYIGAEGIVHENKKYMYLAKNETEFAKYIIELLKNPEKCKIIAENANKFVKEHYSSTKIAAGLIQFYEEQIEKHKQNT